MAALPAAELALLLPCDLSSIRCAGITICRCIMSENAHIEPDGSSSKSLSMIFW